MTNSSIFMRSPAKAGFPRLPAYVSPCWNGLFLKTAAMDGRFWVPAKALSRLLAANAAAVAIKDDRKSKPSTQLHAVNESRRRPAFEFHAELQAALEQHVLDLGQRLLAEIRRLQQFDFGLLHEIADVVDALGLEAVGRAHGELEIVDRTQQNGIHATLLGLGAFAFATREIAEHGELILQDFGGLAHRFFCVDRAVGFDIKHELVKIGALFETRAVDVVGDATHRTERGIELQAADRTRFFVRQATCSGRLIAD